MLVVIGNFNCQRLLLLIIVQHPRKVWQAQSGAHQPDVCSLSPCLFPWLVRREIIDRNPFDRVVFPKVGKPLIRTIEPEESERLLLACTAPGEVGLFADRAAARNRAILWILYDTGIRLSELCGLRSGDFDRKHALIIVQGKGSKERRIALGNNCLRNLLSYLYRHRPVEEELAEWGSAGEDHLFLAETRTPLTKNGVHMLFSRLRKRAGKRENSLSCRCSAHAR